MNHSRTLLDLLVAAKSPGLNVELKSGLAALSTGASSLGHHWASLGLYSTGFQWEGRRASRLGAGCPSGAKRRGAEIRESRSNLS
jgi:hypothetical protein